MTGEAHDDIRRELGVYVLGALQPAERSRVEHHLAVCATCRNEVASLAALPPLLGRLPATDGHAEPPAFAAVAERIAGHRRRTRRRERFFGVLAVASALVAIAVLAAPLGEGRAEPGLRFRNGGVVATIEERSWGMAVRIEAGGLPDRPGYVAYAVAADGHRAQIASWEATGEPVLVEGACYLSPAEVQRVEIVTGGEDDDVLSVLQRG